MSFSHVLVVLAATYGGLTLLALYLEDFSTHFKLECNLVSRNHLINLTTDEKVFLADAYRIVAGRGQFGCLARTAVAIKH